MQNKSRSCRSCRSYGISLFALFIVALVILRGSSCLRTDRPYTTPSAKEVIAALEARGKRIETLRAETRMSHRTSQGKIKATVRLMAQRGGRVRFDAVTPFDTPLATFVSNGSTFGLLDARKNRHFHGPASPCNIARLLGVVLNADDVLTILGGSTPVIKYKSASLSWDQRATAEVLTLTGPTMTQTIRLDGSNRRWDLLSSEIRDHEGEVVLWIKTGTFRQLDGISAPQKIWIKQPKYKAELDIVFKKQELNVTLPAVAFVPPQAGGLTSQRVDCSTPIKN